MGEWREGMGVEPIRDVYSPIPDLKSGRITGSFTLPWAERWYSVQEPVSRTIDFPATRANRSCPPYLRNVSFAKYCCKSSEMVN
jgi:hypothetical protein